MPPVDVSARGIACRMLHIVCCTFHAAHCTLRVACGVAIADQIFNLSSSVVEIVMVTFVDLAHDEEHAHTQRTRQIDVLLRLVFRLKAIGHMLSGRGLGCRVQCDLEFMLFSVHGVRLRVES